MEIDPSPLPFPPGNKASLTHVTRVKLEVVAVWTDVIAAAKVSNEWQIEPLEHASINHFIFLQAISFISRLLYPSSLAVFFFPSKGIDQALKSPSHIKPMPIE